MKKITIIIFFIFLSCNKQSNDRIILTSGLSMNPNEQRFGIEIKNDTLYYCEEIANSPAKYYYYKAKIDPIIFTNLRNEVKKEFKVVVANESIVDATPFQLYTSFDGKMDKKKFYFTFLNNKQKEIIRNIIKFKGIKLEKINFHNFPKELLEEKLPDPPFPNN